MALLTQKALDVTLTTYFNIHFLIRVYQFYPLVPFIQLWFLYSSIFSLPRYILLHSSWGVGLWWFCSHPKEVPLICLVCGADNWTQALHLQGKHVSVELFSCYSLFWNRERNELTTSPRLAYKLPCCPGIDNPGRPGLKFIILLSLFPICWNDRCAQPHLALIYVTLLVNLTSKRCVCSHMRIHICV